MQAAQQPNSTPQQALTRAVQFSKSGNLAQAEQLCRRIIEVQPDFHQAYFQLGLIAVQVGKSQVAADMIVQALQRDPTNFVYHRVSGEVYRRLGHLDKAIHHGQQATSLAPQDAESFYNLGIALADSGKLEEAVQAYNKALSNKPDYGLAANNLGSAMEKLGNEESAVQAYRKAIEINPAHTEAQNNLGAVLSARGELDEAKACFSAAIEANPSFVHAHHNISTIKKYSKDDPHLAALESLLKSAPQMPDDSRMQFWFAIGKAWDDTGRYKEAFDAFQRGNKLKRKTFQYDISNTEQTADDIIKKFDSAFAKKKTTEFDDASAVFIVGMPRSGTTLIEQILSSHSKIYGAGELKDFTDVVQEFQDDKAPHHFMEWLLQADDKKLQEIGEAYIGRLRSLDSKAVRITDKMMGNFFYVGLIHKALPKAKIIYSVRNPLDIGISIYSRLFNETMPFAYDLEELGRYYNLCNRMMEHWKQVLPKGAILEVKYENIIAGLETQARRLIDYCGLEWEDACLGFYKNKRPVKTASIAQVRQPIYKSSVARWENYRTQLAPLREIVGK